MSADSITAGERAAINRIEEAAIDGPGFTDALVAELRRARAEGPIATWPACGDYCPTCSRLRREAEATQQDCKCPGAPPHADDKPDPFAVEEPRL